MMRPANSMDPTAPIPSPRISSPRSVSVIWWRGNNKGICGAQAPMTKPLAPKNAPTPQRPRWACTKSTIKIILRSLTAKGVAGKYSPDQPVPSTVRKKLYPKATVRRPGRSGRRAGLGSGEVRVPGGKSDPRKSGRSLLRSVPQVDGGAKGAIRADHEDRLSGGEGACCDAVSGDAGCRMHKKRTGPCATARTPPPSCCRPKPAVRSPQPALCPDQSPVSRPVPPPRQPRR